MRSARVLEIPAMNRRVTLVVVALACLALGVFAEDEELYPDKYDHLDVDAVLANDRLRTQYYKCFLGTGPCATPDAIFFKERFPEAVVTKCRKCTARQREAFEKIAVWFNENDPEAWDAVIRKGVTDFQQKALKRQREEKKKE